MQERALEALRHVLGVYEYEPDDQPAITATSRFGVDREPEWTGLTWGDLRALEGMSRD